MKIKTIIQKVHVKFHAIGKVSIMFWWCQVYGVTSFSLKGVSFYKNEKKKKKLGSFSTPKNAVFLELDISVKKI